MLNYNKKTTKNKVSAEAAVVLVGTYKSNQLDWIKTNGVYNYPVKDGDEFAPEAFGKIKELWLYADAKGTRHCFTAEFIGKMTQTEFLAAYPTYAGLGTPKQKAYYVFKTEPQTYDPQIDNPIVLVRAIDFGKRSAKMRKAIEQFKSDGKFTLLDGYLPAELASVPSQQIHICKESFQVDFLDELMPVVVNNTQRGITPQVFTYGKCGVSVPHEPTKKVDAIAMKPSGRDAAAQAKYRAKLLEECPYCPITKISDERLLVASHIKPCAVSEENEAFDPKNGFTLSPLYDRLFDQGFISFDDKKCMLVSNWISPSNQGRCHIKAGTFIQMLPLDSKREFYLQYHRQYVFKG